METPPIGGETQERKPLRLGGYIDCPMLRRTPQIFAAILASTPALPAITVEELFPYGAATGDTSLPSTDDVTVSISLLGIGPVGSSMPVHFPTSTASSIFVNENGTLSFLQAVPTWVGQHFPINPSVGPILAPFWTDVDTSNAASGKIWYRTLQEESSLNYLAARFEAALPGNQGFVPTFAQVITWDHVGYYNQQADKLNTFQAIFASDGLRSFALFQYPEITWVAGSANPSTKAQMGYDLGDLYHYYDNPGSQTDAMLNLPTQSNTVPNQAGVFAFDLFSSQARMQMSSGKVEATTLSAPVVVETLDVFSPGSTISSAQRANSLQFNQLTSSPTSMPLTLGGQLVAKTNAANALTGNSLILQDQSILATVKSGALSNGSITLKDSAEVQSHWTGSINGQAALTFDASNGGAGGKLDLRGYAATVGTLSSLGGSAGIVTSSRPGTVTLILDPLLAGRFSGTIENGAGTLSLVKDGAELQVLAGTNTYTGTTRIAEGILQFANPSALYNDNTAAWTSVNLIVEPGAVAGFTVGDTGAFTMAQVNALLSQSTNDGLFKPGAFVGIEPAHPFLPLGVNPLSDLQGGTAPLGFAKLGGGTVYLLGSHSYTGGTLIHDGLLYLTANEQLSDAGSLTVRNGYLMTADYSETVASFKMHGGIISGSATVGGLTAPTFELHAGTIEVPLRGANGTLTKLGPGTVHLNGVNSYSGTTIVTDGTLAFGHRAALYGGDVASSVLTKLTVMSGATAAFAVGGANGFTVGEVMGLLHQSTAAGPFRSGSSVGFQFADSMVLSGLGDVNGGQSSIGLSLLGGTTTFGSNINYTGPTDIYDSTLILSQAGQLSDTAPLILRHWNSKLILSSGTETVGSLKLNGGEIPSGALSASNFDVTEGIIGAQLTGSGMLTKSGPGNITLSGSNTFSGGVRLQDGVLELRNTATLGTGAISFEGGWIHFRGSNGIGSATITTAPNQKFLFDALGSNPTIVAGLQSENGYLQKDGPGRLTLSGPVALSSADITAGTLRLSSSQQTITTVRILTGATLELTTPATAGTVWLHDGIITGTANLSATKLEIPAAEPSTTPAASINAPVLVTSALIDGRSVNGTGSIQATSVIARNATVSVAQVKTKVSDPTSFRTEGATTIAGTGTARGTIRIAANSSLRLDSPNALVSGALSSSDGAIYADQANSPLIYGNPTQPDYSPRFAGNALWVDTASNHIRFANFGLPNLYKLGGGTLEVDSISNVAVRALGGRVLLKQIPNGTPYATFNAQGGMVAFRVGGAGELTLTQLASRLGGGRLTAVAGSLGVDTSNATGSLSLTAPLVTTSPATFELQLAKLGTGTLNLNSATGARRGVRVEGGTLVVNATGVISQGTVEIAGGELYIPSPYSISQTPSISGGKLRRDLAIGGSLSGVNKTKSDFAGGIDTTATFLAGTTGAARSVEVSFAPTSSALNDIRRLSDAMTLTGTGNDTFALQLSVTDASGGTVLGWLNGNNQWAEAFSGNTGNNATIAARNFNGSFLAFQAVFGTNLSQYIGAYGYDTQANTVWSVINHGGNFAVIPEPSASALVLLGGVIFIRSRPKRRSKIEQHSGYAKG